MAISDSFRDFIAEQMRPLAGVEIRRMFGGAAAFANGRIFALLDDDLLYFKVDAQTAASFEAEGLEPFSYPSKNGTMTMNGYRRCPDRLFDDQDEFVVWANAAIAAAGRTAKPKKSRRKPG